MTTAAITIDITCNCPISSLAEWVLDAIREEHPCAVPVETMADMLQEWAEQALLNIIDTPDEWIKNAVLISSCVYNHVDLYAAGWLMAIESYVSTNS